MVVSTPPTNAHLKTENISRWRCRCGYLECSHRREDSGYLLSISWTSIHGALDSSSRWKGAKTCPRLCWWFYTRMGLHQEFSESFGLSCWSTFSLIRSLKFSFSYFDDVPGHKSFVMDLKYDANFNRVASTGGSSVQLWQLEEGDQIILNLVMVDSLTCTSSIITRNTTTHDCLPYWFTVWDHRCTLLGWWGKCYDLYNGDSSGVSNIMSFGWPKSELYLSECYTVQPWKLLYFSCDFAALHFAMFFDQIFKLQLLTQFLTDFPKIWTVYLPVCILYI